MNTNLSYNEIKLQTNGSVFIQCVFDFPNLNEDKMGLLTRCDGNIYRNTA